jgi:hypothetical protein
VECTRPRGVTRRKSTSWGLSLGSLCSTRSWVRTMTCMMMTLRFAMPIFVIKIVSRADRVESFAWVLNFGVFDDLLLWSCLSGTLFDMIAENSWACPWFS